MHTHDKTLLEIHEDVPADHYDVGIKRNLFQKYWHGRRFKELLSLINFVEGPVLDVGCHSGTFTSKILTKIGSQEIYGIDISKEAIKLAQKRLPHGHFQTGNAEKLPYRENFFAAAFCLEMLEHVDNPIAVLAEIERVLKKGAYLYILVPSESKLFKFVWFLWTMYYSHWRHAHVQSYHKNILEQIVKKIGFKLIKVKTFNLGMLRLIICQKVKL